MYELENSFEPMTERTEHQMYSSIPKKSNIPAHNRYTCLNHKYVHERTFAIQPIRNTVYRGST